jgi:hypothetical protein
VKPQAVQDSISNSANDRRRVMASFEEARRVKREHSLRLLQIPGVSGVDVQTDAGGQGVICIHVDAQKPPSPEDLPRALDDVPVKVLHSGPFEKQT